MIETVSAIVTISFYRVMCYLLIVGMIRHVISSVTNKSKFTTTNFQPVTLLTFDVDGTLLHGSSKRAEGSAHARAFTHAIGKIFYQDGEYEKKYPSPLHFVPPQYYHGSTDGLIAINLAYYSGNILPEVSYTKLSEIFREMYNYIAKLQDSEVAQGMEALPGVLSTLKELRDTYGIRNQILCGLVTGNVESIARKKMRATGIYQTKIFSRRASDQVMKGEDDVSILGGFGSDYCSGDIQDTSRIYKDRGEQIVIATKRAKTLLSSNQKLVRVVHIGDAPNDILAAKWCAENNRFGSDVIVGCVGVATGKFSVQELTTHAGHPIDGIWEPVILEQGLHDPKFISSLKII